MWTTNFCWSFSKNILLYMSSRKFVQYIPMLCPGRFISAVYSAVSLSIANNVKVETVKSQSKKSESLRPAILYLHKICRMPPPYYSPWSILFSDQRWLLRRSYWKRHGRNSEWFEGRQETPQGTPKRPIRSWTLHWPYLLEGYTPRTRVQSPLRLVIYLIITFIQIQTKRQIIC